MSFVSRLTDLPSLRILRVSQTRVTDAGWIQASREPTSDIHRPLFTLEASGLHNQLTYQGLEAIVNLFPQLRRLNVAASNLYVTKSPTTNVLNDLTHLDVSDCDQLEYLPSCLTPPRSGCNPSQGLATLRIRHCTRLNLALVLDQLQGATDLSTVLIQLQQFRELQMLDLGGQVLGEPEFEAVEQVINCLPNINSLIIATLP
ncbi:uncharacterized protein DEA37_0014061 [Paragonimus westermani]|uniref:Uncharacterized protein n=1 Tax=Paragonimus westermani TaxID=34504 RepID=A0A5J4NUQ9_9TREM|nr:uncharacterized protein DEA37_0014061 [Paragonimus westermani]